MANPEIASPATEVGPLLKTQYRGKARDSRRRVKTRGKAAR